MNLARRIYRSSKEKLAKRIRWRITSVPRPTFESLNLVLAYYTAIKPGATFIQVGACDGQTHDAANKFVKAGRFQAVLIEPIPANFAQLTKEYAGIAPVRLLHAAVSNTSGSSEIFHVKDEGRWKGHDYAKQWASFDRRHLLRHGVDDAEIATVKIPTVTLAEVLARQGFESIDILQIDTEGFDADVVEMALALPTPPRCIYFEYIHIKKRLPALMEKLEQAGFSWNYDRWNVLAVHRSMANAWT